jgi:hypothetical protein
MSLTKNVKFWFTALIGLWALIIFATLGQQTAAAQSRVNDLKPPFNFVQASEPDRPLIALRPPGATVIMAETFGAGFNPVTQVTGTLPLWRHIASPADTGGYLWDRVGAGSPVTFANSAWSAGTNLPLHNPLIAGVDEYPAGQDTWLLYGPIDLSRYTYATLSFEYYLDATADDQLIWGVTADGIDVIGHTSLGGNGGAQWITGTYQFDRALWGDNAVYIAFAFQSGSTPNGLGAFIRNVQLNAEPIRVILLPVTVNDYPPTPTPTPTATPVPPLFGYTFDSGNADLAEWGGAYYNTGTTRYGQCLPGQCTIHYTTPHGNPADSLRLYTNGLYSFIASSPNDIAPDNFDLYVDISPWVIYPRNANCPFGCPDNDLGDWYGVIFNASADTFGANPSQFAYNKTYYRLYFYNVDSVKPVRLKLERCDGSSNASSNTCRSLGSSSLPGNFIGNASGFDTVRIERQASGLIRVSLNGTVLITATDATYTGSGHGKFGTFIFSWTANDTQSPPIGYEMQVDFDNIIVYQR